MIYLNAYHEHQGRVLNEVAKHLKKRFIFTAGSTSQAAKYITVQHSDGGSKIVKNVDDVHRGDVVVSAFHSRYENDLKRLIDKGVHFGTISEDLVDIKSLDAKRCVKYHMFVAGMLEVDYAGFGVIPPTWHLTGNPRYDAAFNTIRTPKPGRVMIFDTFTIHYDKSYPRDKSQAVERYKRWWRIIKILEPREILVSSHPRASRFTKVQNVFNRIAYPKVGIDFPENLIKDVDFALVASSISTFLTCLCARVPTLFWSTEKRAHTAIPEKWFLRDERHLVDFTTHLDTYLAEQQAWVAKKIVLDGHSAERIANVLMELDENG